MCHTPCFSNLSEAFVLCKSWFGKIRLSLFFIYLENIWNMLKEGESFDTYYEISILLTFYIHYSNSVRDTNIMVIKFYQTSLFYLSILPLHDILLAPNVKIRFTEIHDPSPSILWPWQAQRLSIICLYNLPALCWLSEKNTAIRNIYNF